jgi:Transposase DDE domain
MWPYPKPLKEGENMAELNDTRDLDKILMTIYCFVDEFLGSTVELLEPAIEKQRISNQNPPTKQRNLRLSEIVTLGLFRFYVGSSNWKDFYWHIRSYHSQDFPTMPSYSKFIEAINFSSPLAYFLCLSFAETFREAMPLDEPKLADSSKLQVCGIKREFSHKVCRHIAAKSKSSMGWFYGFKLHIVANRLMQILAVTITPGNTDDRKGLSQIWRYIFGLIVADGGYVGKEFSDLAKTLGKQLLTGVRANMKKIMTAYQHRLLRLRQCVETVFSVLKLRFHLEITLPRSPIGYFSHYSWCLAAYQLKQFFKASQPLSLNLIA